MNPFAKPLNRALCNGDGRVNGYVRDVPGGVLHVAASDDTSPAWPGPYLYECSWCYLGAGHTERAHAESAAQYAAAGGEKGVL